MESVVTTCPFCACGCAVYLHTHEGRLVGSSPSEHHPVARGRLCARGWNAHEAPGWGERLTRPLVRRKGTLERVSWPDALHAAAESISGVLSSGGTVGVLGSARATNEENYLAARLARAGFRSGHVDSCLRATYRPFVEGFAAVAGAIPCGTLADVEGSDVILVLEGDLAGSHPQAAHSVIRAVKAGATLITAGCARTQLARLAALHLPVAPGRRERLLAGLVAAAARGEAPDRHRKVLTGHEALKASLPEPVPDGPPFEAARAYLAAERASILIAPELGPPGRAAREGGAVAALAALAGHLGRPGCAVLPLPARGNLRGACEMGVAPDLLPGAAPLSDGAAVQRLARAWGCRPALDEGQGAEAIVREAAGLLVLAEDLPAVLPMGRQALAAIADKACLVVLDAFATPTANAAGVVLPIASFAETEGTTISLDGRIQRSRPVLRPPGDAMPGWQAMAELSALLGLPQPYRSAADVLREIGEVVPAWDGVGDRILTEAWGTFEAAGTGGRELRLGPLGKPENGRETEAVLALEGVFDWGSDPLVGFSPTLCRDHLSQRKLFPRGLVRMSTRDADALGVRQGWAVRMVTPHGEVVLPVELRSDLEPGVLLVPFAFRDQVAGAMAGRGQVPVKPERVQ